MFNLGAPELIFILVLALLIFGPRKLPELGRTLGKGMAEFRRASNELKRTLNTEGLEQELRENDPRRMIRDAVEAPLREIKESVETEAKAIEKAADPVEATPPEEETAQAKPEAEEDAEDGPAGPEGTVARSGPGTERAPPDSPS